jgi:hypothetical protein
VPEKNEALYLISLRCALRDKVPLRPVDASAARLEEACEIANDGLESDEVVLIEDNNNASNVLGVLYAHYRSALLVVSPQPDISSVDSL